MKRVLYIIVSVLLVLLLAACEKECVHEYSSEISVAVTCTQAGEEVHTCIHCQESYTTVIEPIGHTFGEGVEAKAAGCQEPGQLVYQCENCEETKTEEIPLLEHSYDEGTVQQEATCAETGKIVYSCLLCQEEKQEQIPSLPHTPGEPTLTKEPNCTQMGEMSAICTACGQSEVVEQVPTNDTHVLREVVLRAPTCIAEGAGELRCELCDYSKSVSYQISDHRYGDPVILQPATCSEKGSQESICTVCGYVKTETIEQLEHTWDTAKCNSPATCTVCGYYNSKGVSHQYKYDSTIQPSSHFVGKRIYVCANCSKIRNEYFGRTGDYDLQEVVNYANSYAASLGLGIAYSDDGGDPDYKISAEYSKVEASGGLSYVKSMAKGLVDRLYARLQEGTAGMDAYTVYIKVYYTQSGAVGQGYFGVYLYMGYT